jgi:L-cysteine/cystine lyase
MIRTVVAPFSPEPERLAAVRAALPALGASIYLNTGSVGPLPAETATAMEDLARWERDLGRGSPDSIPDVLQRLAEARAAAASVLGTDPANVAVTRSTTDGVNTYVLALDLRPGDEVVTTNQEHPGITGPLALAAARGVKVMVADIGDGGDDGRTLAAIEAAITERTRLVAVSHVLFMTGAVLPIAGIAAVAHRHGVPLLVDGAQSAGAIPVAFDALGADAYAIAGQKWLLGPEGTGALAMRPEAIASLTPALGGYFNFESLGPTGVVLWPDARRFEYAFIHRPSVLGFARSIAWLQMFVGLDWVHQRGMGLARTAAERLAGIPGVRVLTPIHQMATLITFTIDGWPAAAAYEELGKRIFAMTRTIDPLGALRISVGFFNTAEEIELVATTIELLAAHTPETLPPRPTLTILEG